jgi:hypothetical protein
MTRLLALSLMACMAWTLSPSVPTYADDHLFTPDIATGTHRPDGFFDTLHDSPGQGVPFVGGDTSVPATATHELTRTNSQPFPGVGAEAAPNADKFK